MIDIKANQFFWECSGGQCEYFKAFGDAYYEEEDVVVLYAMHVNTQATQRFMMRPSASTYSPKFYKEKPYTG